MSFKIPIILKIDDLQKQELKQDDLFLFLQAKVEAFLEDYYAEALYDSQKQIIQKEN